MAKGGQARKSGILQFVILVLLQLLALVHAKYPRLERVQRVAVRGKRADADVRYLRLASAMMTCVTSRAWK